MVYYVLYHTSSGAVRTMDRFDPLKECMKGDELVFQNVMEISSYELFFKDFPEGAALILAGGDGTIHQFVNRTKGLDLSMPIYYYALGTGNDFLRDIGGKVGDAPVLINEYLKNLPTVTVKGETYYYIDGVGYGVDGYCCEMGDIQKSMGNNDVNYTSIAIKGVLFDYKPCNATVTVDGEVHHFKKVWIVPTMNGRYYGGGMMATPQQDRKNPEGLQSVMIYGGRGRIPTLMNFPNIFKGEHVKSSMVTIFTGKHIKVEFDSPRPLQIDGETISDVSSYEVNAEN